ncbi:MAG: carbohydrate-binding family 9-like protein [Myxococcales bacterium]|nr:carbohydrate-binding family 9-like protein [Myxococcales bacterium]MCB9755653.1 carbohydrate-binding family 9-like protein [Myxococcales bacterium]
MAAGLAALLPLACGVDPRGADERAEPPVEAVARARADATGAEDSLEMSSSMELAGGLRIDTVALAPAEVVPGEVVQVTGVIHGANARAGFMQLALRTPHSAARQVVFPGGVAPRPLAPDERDVRVTLEPGQDGAFTAALPVPEPWHPRTAVVTLEVHTGGPSSPLRPALRGPRLDDGSAVLGVVPVATRPTQVQAARARARVALDGRLDDEVWQRPGDALGDSLFGEPVPGPHTGDELPGLTRVWFAWDAQHLYVAGELPDVDLFSDYAEQDDPLYKQEAFEVFVSADNSGSRYLEYQVSARGVTFDARFPRYRKGDEAWDSSWSVAVDAQGTVNNARDRDVGWSVEVAIPWAELCAETAIQCPPRQGQRLRVNVFRLEKLARKRSIGLALSPTRRPDFHAWANAAELELGAPVAEAS